eukprot:scaffold3575_cov107-Isochrysis_galbana.AAC.3
MTEHTHNFRSLSYWVRGLFRPLVPSATGQRWRLQPHGTNAAAAVSPAAGKIESLAASCGGNNRTNDSQGAARVGEVCHHLRQGRLGELGLVLHGTTHLGSGAAAVPTVPPRAAAAAAAERAAACQDEYDDEADD